MGLELAGLIIGGIGAAVGAGSSIAGAVQQREAAHDAKSRARKNAAELARRGDEEARLRRLQGRRLQAAQRARIGSSGLATSSFFDTLVDSAVQEEFAAQRVREEYSLEAGLTTQRGALEARASNQRAKALVLGGVTDFATSAGNLALKKYEYDKL